MKNVFWNRDEKRLRAGWRLVLFLWALALALFALSLLTFGLMGAGLGDVALQIQPLLLLAAFGGALFLSARFLDRRPLAEYGFHFSRAWWSDFGFGLGLGAALMGLIFALELGLGWLEIQPQAAWDSSFWAGILAALLQFIAVGIYEEIFSRAYQLRNLAEGLNWKRIGPRTALILAMIISSFIFGALHLGNPNATLISALNISLAGIFLGLGLALTGELAIPIAIHITWNFFQGNVFGFPVSGTNAGTSLIAIRQGGPELLTGGAFGPEAGLLGVLAMLLGCAAILLWVRWRRGSVHLHTPLSVYRLPTAADAPVPQQP